MNGGLSETLLVRECFQQSGKNKTDSGDDSFADGVLAMLHGEMGGMERKKSQKNLYHKMTRGSFVKAALEGSNFDLFQLYVARYFEKLKKVNTAWIQAHGGIIRACNEISSKPSPAKDGAQPVSKSETSETYIENLSKKIQHGLESGMDLQNLAECAVKSSVQWFHHNREIENNSEGQQQSVNISDDSYGEVVGGKIIELLLRSPKEMKKIQQDFDSYSSDNIVREYEMQILLQIEILRSDVSAMLGESRKKKLLKQICALLEIIQYLVEGGIHGHVSLYDDIERTIRSRYSNELDDIVNKIYIKMDLLPFGDEEQAPSFVFNSEDSNQSWRDNKHDKNEKAEPNSINNSFSTEGDSSQPPPTNACDR
ncbi:hypothetical protein CASFOL_002797 [Castilleja foliolosa]|uniref:Uncharacterized protein n=1 Tax=Castilleja foliolosa TaxID=1961234 RepID=A0ABD3EG11_9LAMI